MAQTSIKFIPMRSFSAFDLKTEYQPINNTGLEGPLLVLYITNATNSKVTISFDGTTDHAYLLEGQSIVFNSSNSQMPILKAYTQVYVKGPSGVGFVTIFGYYI